jgi:hypothetical protein
MVGMFGSVVSTSLAIIGARAAQRRAVATARVA